MKAILYVVGFVVLLFAGYIAYLAATYIDESVSAGSAYGFEIGLSKKQSFQSIRKQVEKYPNLVIYYSYGNKAGDNETVRPVDNEYSKVEVQDRWTLLLDGEGEFFNVIKLSFDEDKLIRIYRHRKYFELP
ncbi:MAG: hypothetical protein ACR2PU_00475 [Gammaproteobacteria bacterium]